MVISNNKKKKAYLIIAIISLFLTIASVLCGIFIFEAFYIVLPFSVPLLITFFILSFLFNEFFKYELTINNFILTYKSHKRNFSFYLNEIEKISYTIQPRKTVLLLFLYNKEIKVIYGLKKNDILKIQEYINIDIEIRNEIIPLKVKFKNFIIDLKRAIKDHQKEIIFVLIGLIISTISFFIFLKKLIPSNLNFILFIICILYGTIEAYFIYFKKKMSTTFERIFLLIMALIIYTVIIFAAVLLFFCVFLKLKFSIDYLYYVIFSIPSFVIVIGIVALALLMLAYS